MDEWGEKSNFKFNPMVKHADIFMKPRVAYLTEVLRQLAQSSSSSQHRQSQNCLVGVVEHDFLPFVE